MSSESTMVTAAHFAYLAQRTAGDDEFLRTLKHDAAAAGIPEIWISPEQASFMRILLSLCSARRVLEVGTLAGYSAITMARVLPADGEVVSLEIEALHADFARDRIERSDVAGRVQVILGDARATLPDLADASFDAAFLDADKVGYGEYLDHAHRLLRPGGLLMVDNAFAFGELLDDGSTSDSVAAVRAFNERLANDARFEGVIVPIGDGLWVAQRA